MKPLAHMDNNDHAVSLAPPDAVPIRFRAD